MPSTILGRTVALLYRMTDADTQQLENQLLDARKRSWGTALQNVAKEHGCTSAPNAPRLADLEELKRQSHEDALSIAKTFNFDVEVQIERIFEETRTANRFVFFKRLEDWNTQRNTWKLPSIALNTDVTTSAYARQQFFENNGITSGKYIADGPPPTCEICISYFAAGVVDYAYVRRHGFPAHINCPHRWAKLKPEKLDCGKVWIGGESRLPAPTVSTARVSPAPKTWNGASPTRISLSLPQTLEDQAQAWAKELTNTQRSAVREYTGGAFSHINHIVMGDPMDDPHWKEITPDVLSAFKSAPKTNEVTWRGIRDASGSYFEDRLVRWSQRVGTEMQWGRISSASTDPEIAAQFSAGQEGIVFEIQSNQGRYITPASSYDDESEVIFLPGSKFRIADVQRLGIENEQGNTLERVFVILEDITNE